MKLKIEVLMKSCPVCQSDNIAYEGHVDKNDVLNLKFLCHKCQKKYRKRKTLGNVKVNPLKGISWKGHREKGGRKTGLQKSR